MSIQVERCTFWIQQTIEFYVGNFGDPMGTVIVGGRSWGASLAQISTSYGMFVDSQYNVFVSDSGNARVTKWFFIQYHSWTIGKSKNLRIFIELFSLLLLLLLDN